MDQNIKEAICQIAVLSEEKDKHFFEALDVKSKEYPVLPLSELRSIAIAINSYSKETLGSITWVGIARNQVQFGLWVDPRKLSTEKKTVYKTVVARLSVASKIYFLGLSEYKRVDDLENFFIRILTLKPEEADRFFSILAEAKKNQWPSGITRANLDWHDFSLYRVITTLDKLPQILSGELLPPL